MQPPGSSDHVPPQRRARIPQPLLLAFASASAYLLAFYFEKGVFDAYALPPDMIEVRLTTLLLFAALSIAAFASIFPILSAAALILSNIAHPVLARAIAPLSLVAVPALLVAYLFGTSGSAWWPPLLGLALFIAFLQLVFPLITQAKTKGYINKLMAQEEIESQVRGIPDYISARLGKDILLLIGALLVGTSLAWMIGQAQALNKTSFLTLDADPTLLVVRTYPDRVLLARLDEESASVVAQFAIMAIPADGLRLSVRELGPVHLPGVARPTASPPATATEPAQMPSQTPEIDTHQGLPPPPTP